jgi:hypothetical protein
MKQRRSNMGFLKGALQVAVGNILTPVIVLVGLGGITLVIGGVVWAINGFEIPSEREIQAWANAHVK